MGDVVGGYVVIYWLGNVKMYQLGYMMNWDDVCVFFVIYCECMLCCVVQMFGVDQVMVGWWFVMFEYMFGVMLFLCLLKGYLFMLVGELVLCVVEVMEQYVYELVWLMYGVDWWFVGEVKIMMIDVFVIEFVMLLIVWLYVKYFDVFVVLNMLIYILNFVKCEVDIVICIVWFENFDLVVCWLVCWDMGLFVLFDYLCWYGEFECGCVFVGYDFVVYQLYIDVSCKLIFVGELIDGGCIVMCMNLNLMMCVVLCVGFGVGEIFVYMGECDGFMCIWLDCMWQLLYEVWFVMYCDLCYIVCICVVIDEIVVVFVVYC